ncbi:MAG TPA: hypothetical protein P5248_10875 [Bacteroidales bacterium]|nr:hypothetical protein [Bacteroidales bacterium]
MFRTLAIRMDQFLAYRLKRMGLYHAYFLRSGFYRFALKNTIYLVVIAAVLIGAFTYIESHIIDLGLMFESFMRTLDSTSVFILFFISESFLGLLPPDFFILWLKEFDNRYELITLLATLSYIGGIIAYFMGRGLSFHPAISRFIASKYKKNFQLVRKWGGVFVVLAALTPLPFSIVCLLSGLLRYPKVLFIAFSATRFIRFYAYAWAIFSLL